MPRYPEWAFGTIVFMDCPIASPAFPPQKFQYPAPTSGLTVLEVMWFQISVLPVNVMLRPSASTIGAINELNSCAKNKRAGRDKAPSITSLLTIREASRPLLRTRAVPINRHNKEVLLFDMYKSHRPISNSTKRSHGMRLHDRFLLTARVSKMSHIKNKLKTSTISPKVFF